MSDLIPDEIDSEEILVRAILHPLFCSRSKNTLNSNAFSPPPRKGRSDVSVIRLKYCTPTKCKKVGKELAEKLSNQSYFGLATVVVSVLNDAYDYAVNATQDSKEQPIGIKAVFTPLDIKRKLRLDRPVRISDAGLPFHADIVYDFCPIEGQPLPVFVKIMIDFLIKPSNSRLYKDPSPDLNIWEGPLQ
ncbi:MAG: hypothetical protein WD077_14870 [Bacteroidia bacterium]